jgi:hypothetical protein
VAVILFIVLALARPSVKVAGGILGGGKEPVAAALVFDTSLRMEYRHENQTRLQIAQQLGEWLLSQLPAESDVAVLDSREGSAAFQVDLGAAKERITRLEASSVAKPLPGVLDEAVRLLNTSQKERREVYVFTDLARVAWPETAGAKLQQAFETSDAGVYVIDVGVVDPTNLGLGDLRLPHQTIPSNGTLRISTQVNPINVAGQRTVEMYLLEPGKDGERAPVKIGDRQVTLVPGQPQQIELKRSGLARGTHQGYLQIFGEDGMPADDRRFFTIDVRPPLPILVVAPRPAESYARNLTEALAPEKFRRNRQARFECTTIAQDQLARHDLEPYAAIFLLDPKPLEPSLWQTLGNYVAAGHGLAVFLGKNATPVDSFNSEPAQEVLAGPLRRQAMAAEGDSYTLAPEELQHPILEDFREMSGAVPWFLHPIYRYWQLGGRPDGVDGVVRYNDRDPAILKRSVGKGRAITVTTPISDDPNRSPWNLLPVGLGEPIVYVMLVNQMAAYLGGSGGQNLNYAPGQTAILELDPKQNFQSYALSAPGDVQSRITPDPKENVLVIAGTDRVGNYRVRAGGTVDGVDRGFSVNLPAEQTQLDRITEEQLKSLFGTVPYRLARGKDEIEINVTTGRVGRELFAYLILALAALLALEHAAANRFYRGA